MVASAVRGSPCGRFDFDHIGAEVGEKLAGVRRSDPTAILEETVIPLSADSGNSRHGVRVALASGQFCTGSVRRRETVQWTI